LLHLLAKTRRWELSIICDRINIPCSRSVLVEFAMIYFKQSTLQASIPATLAGCASLFMRKKKDAAWVDFYTVRAWAGLLRLS